MTGKLEIIWALLEWSLPLAPFLSRFLLASVAAAWVITLYSLKHYCKVVVIVGSYFVLALGEQ